MRLVAALLASQLAGCAAGLDLLQMGSDISDSGGSHTGLRRPVDQQDTWTEVVLSPADGLVCTQVTRPWVQETTVSVHARSQNGSQTLVGVGVGFDVLWAGLGTIYVEGHCSEKPDDCNRGLGYGLLAPFALSLAWGVYRLATIRAEIWTDASVSQQRQEGQAHDEVRVPCPTGTVVPLTTASGARFDARIDQDGRMASGQLPELVAFLGRAEVIAEPAEGTRMDLGRAREFLAAQAAPPALPGPPVARARIDWRGGQRQVSGVKLDFAPQEMCLTSASCAPGQRCADRGDGVPMCVGPGTGYCLTEKDCNAGSACLAGPQDNGVRRCSAPPAPPVSP